MLIRLPNAPRAALLNQSITAAAGRAHGYYLVASGGGVFAFGEVEFHGSMGGAPSTHPVVAATP